MLGFRSAALLVALFSLSACFASDQDVTRAQGAGAGAAIGAGLGAIIGDDSTDILVGAAAGGLVGLAAGEVVARKKADYATKEDMIVQERKIVAEKADEIGDYNIRLRGQLQTLNQEIATLENEAARGRTARGERISLQKRAQANLDQARQRLVEVNREIDVSRKLYEEAIGDTQPTDLADWDQRIRELERRRDVLTALIGDYEDSTQRIA